jgi:peptidoglycan hydrolase CwlO-like protein
MFKKDIFIYFFFFFLIINCLFVPRNTYSIECTEDNIKKAKNNRDTQALNDLTTSCNIAKEESSKKGTEYDKEKQRLVTQSYLTQLQIIDTEQKIVTTQKEISVLGERIEGLDTSMNYYTKLLLSKVVENYKNKSITFYSVILDSDNVNDFFNRFKYIKTTQQNNQKLLIQVQQTKLNFEEQKNLREEKKKELDNLIITLDRQKSILASQQAATEKLIKQAKDDAAYFDRLRSQASSEYAAIKGIIAGAGDESKIRDVKKGEVIAYIIPGASCNSSGKHLHFIVKDGGEVNPFNYLKSIDSRNCSGSGCNSGDGDPFNPSGNLDWPISGPIELEQGYGQTWAVNHTWVGRIYSFHNGIDINGSSDTITAISDGELYRGSYGVGCSLPYVKLVHQGSNIITYYLHVYSN